MTVADFLDMFNDLSGVELHIWDFTTERVLFSTADVDTCDPVMEVSAAGYDDYEVESCDVYRDREGKNLFMDINIATDEEDD